MALTKGASTCTPRIRGWPSLAGASNDDLEPGTVQSAFTLAAGYLTSFGDKQ